MILAERLTRILKSKGITAYKLSDLTGIHKSGIYRILNGENPNPTQKTLETIAKALDISVSELLGEENNPNIAVKQIDSDTGIAINAKHASDYSADDIKLALEIIDLIKKHQSS